MSQLQGLWDWMAALKTSLPFAIALPIILATVFATLADLFDRYLATYRQAPSQHHADEPSTGALRRQSRGTTPGRSPIEAGGAHNADRY